MKKESSSSLPKIPSKEIMTLAENLAFLAGFAEGISKGNTSESAADEDTELDALIADAELELPKDGWKPTDRF